LIPAGQHLWRLSKGGDGSLGLCCTEDGLFLGRTTLVERRGDGYFVRPQADVERLLKCAYGSEVTRDQVIPGLAVVASALGEKNLCLAQIAAVHLRLPDLPDASARLAIVTEDLLIKLEQSDAQFARDGWDEAKHPRTGTPPNPGWFAPRGGSSAGPAPSAVAANEREERRPEEEIDPLAEVRQAQWEAGIATLRRIDPNNPQLTYFANPGAAPSQEALDRLNAVIETAAIKRVTEKVMPGGMPIGSAGANRRVRELPGGLQAARSLFDYLRVGGRLRLANDSITVVQLPGKAGYITFRPASDSGSPAVDINVPGIPFTKVHFP
jgi:hypothetical protein